MLPKKERLTTTKFNRFFSAAFKLHRPHFSILYTPAPKFSAAVVVGKKVDKRAVTRNRLRRQIYNILYRNKSVLPQVGIFIVLVKPSIKNVSFAEMKDELPSATLEIVQKSLRR